MRTVIRHGLPAVVLLALAVFVAGCGKGTSSTNPGNSPMTQDSADDIAINAIAALNSLGGEIETAAAVGMGGGVPMAALRPASVLWDTTFTSGGITYSASRTFYGPGDIAVPGYAGAIKMVWASTASGSFETPRDTATVGHAGMLTFTDIQVTRDILVLNGGAADTLTNRFRSYDGLRTRFFHWVSVLAIDDVKWPKTVSYPASGTLTFTVSADRLRSSQAGDIEAHWNATVVVTFNGTDTPDVVVNGIWRYHWHMGTGVIVRA